MRRGLCTWSFQVGFSSIHFRLSLKTKQNENDVWWLNMNGWKSDYLELRSDYLISLFLLLFRLLWVLSIRKPVIFLFFLLDDRKPMQKCNRMVVVMMINDESIRIEIKFERIENTCCTGDTGQNLFYKRK